jgi:acyl dehydratase
MGMNKELVGREYTKIEPFPVSAEAGRAYADASNANDIAAYKDIVPPMYGVAYSFAALGAPLFDSDLQVDMMRLVHGDQDMTFVRAVKPGDVIQARSKVAAITEKSTGEVIDVEIACSNQRGEVVLEAKSGLFVRGPRKKDGPEGGGGGEKKDPDEEAWSAAPVAWSVTETVAPDQSKRYAEASGDRNPIHTDDDVAKMAGLPGIILHGLCTMAFVHNACVRKVGSDPARVKRLSVRFARPVLMNDVLTIEARGPAQGPWLLRVTNQVGVVVLKNGRAELG